MANPHPEPHPENLKSFKKGDKSAVDKQSKGGKKSQEVQARKRTMREWAQFYGQLPLHKGKIKDPKTGEEIKDGNPTMDGAVIASAYGRAMKGDGRAMQFLATIKGEFNQEVTVHTDPVATLTEEQLDAIIDAISKTKNADE